MLACCNYYTKIIEQKLALSRVVTVSPTDSVLAATKKMLELRASCAVVTVNDKPCGILT